VSVEITGNGMLCQICFCEYSEEETEILSCKHFFCKECIKNWIKSQICDGKVSDFQLFCPNVECKQPIDTEIIEKLSDPETMIKYRKFSKNLEIDKDKSKIWCPNPLCEGVVCKVSKFSKKGVCDLCGYSVCFGCRKEFHGYFKSCTHREDAEFNKWAKEQFMKRCPSCNKYIMKLEGCNHMTCSCGYQFVRKFDLIFL
jgi:hypothetical protein